VNLRSLVSTARKTLMTRRYAQEKMPNTARAGPVPFRSAGNSSCVRRRDQLFVGCGRDDVNIFQRFDSGVRDIVSRGRRNAGGFGRAPIGTRPHKRAPNC
jgi:hypothetical protein